MSETKRIKRSMDLANGAITFSLGDKIATVDVVKATGIKVSGTALAALTALAEAKLTEFCAGGVFTTTESRFDEFLAALKRGETHVLLPWADRKYILGLVEFWRPIRAKAGKPAPTELEAAQWIERAKGTPDKKNPDQTAFDTLCSIPAFRKVIPKQNESEDPEPDVDVLKAMGLE